METEKPLAFLLSWTAVTLYLVSSILAKPVLPHRMKETKGEDREVASIAVSLVWEVQ
jgi:hypothetical protein